METREEEAAAYARIKAQNQFDEVKFDATRKREREKMMDIIAAGFKQLSLTHHPDRGGSTTALDLLVRARDLLKRHAEGWN